MYTRENTRPVMVGDVQIGGANTVVIQSMTTTKTRDVDATVKQILELEDAGCEIVRCTIPTKLDAYALKEIKKQVNIPIVADIHFNYQMALLAIENGADKIRINPGNIGQRENVEKVVNACKEKNIPIRIGVNAGSLENDILEKYGYPTAEGMLESAKFHVAVLEELDFHDIIISMKASSIDLAIEAYELAAKEFPYPLHLGITEAGTKFSGTVKSVAGLSVLLQKNIGSTIRISLSENPVEEIKVCRELLKNFGLVNNMPTLIACPTCGRIEIDLMSIANELEDFLQTVKAPIKVAVLGCAVNGPGEAREAHIGIAGAKRTGLLIKNGETVRKIPEDDMVQILKDEVLKMEKIYLDHGVFFEEDISK